MAMISTFTLLLSFYSCYGFHLQQQPVKRDFALFETAEFQAPVTEIDRRRNLAIISHPDSGKTTMTEKLLLYGGALQQAGAVRQKAEQRATQSDFMEMEQERGISISSTVMNFDYDGRRVNILDTPGHQDFSEDTYRALAAADNAVMLLDAAKGLEPQTRKLFEVCRMRKLPLFTFCNKMDRPALSPYEIMDQIEDEFSLESFPVLWPIGDGDRFKGVLDRIDNIVHIYTKPTKRGGKAEVVEVPIDDTDRLEELIDDNELFEKLLEDRELLDELITPLDMDRVYAGELTPLFFGSAMTNFGVQLFLDKFLHMGTKPSTRLSISKQEEDEEGLMITPDHEEFTGFVFKTQANLDPKHRDRLAYVRVVSGTYEKGMKVGHSRSKAGKKYNLAQAQALFGSDRSSVEIAYPGDVIGINNPGCFAIGDTLYTGANRVAFPGIPSFSPEKFAYIRSPNPSDYKSFRKGMDQLLDEGAVQALRQRNDDGGGPLVRSSWHTEIFSSDAKPKFLITYFFVHRCWPPLVNSNLKLYKPGWRMNTKSNLSWSHSATHWRDGQMEAGMLLIKPMLMESSLAL